jgi:gliding motility-associated-like protein
MWKLLSCLVLVVITLRGAAQASCEKFPMRAANHISNPSFEKNVPECFFHFSSVPGEIQLDTQVPFWRIPWRSGTVNYYGLCNNFQIPPSIIELKIPQPVPDGEGILNLYDAEGTHPEKSYISTCLNGPFKKGYVYELSMYLGFGKTDIEHNPGGITRKATAPSPEKMILYGAPNCTTVAFPETAAAKADQFNRDCLEKTTIGWTALGTCLIAGDTGTWVKGTIRFTAPFDVNMIAIGPSCDSRLISPDLSGQNIHYYFIDNLHLLESVVAKPAVDITAGSFCDGPNASVTLQLHNASQYQPAQIQWYKNNIPIAATGSSITTSKTGFGPGWYQCGVVGDSLCSRSDSLYVNWYAAPSLQVLGQADTTACTGDRITIDATSAGASYLWEDNSILPVREITETGTYSVTISNACKTVTVTKKISFIPCPAAFFVPGAFTPNHDGLNDAFRPKLKGSVRSYEFIIFDRYGQQLFATTDLNKSWDGTFKRLPQSAGTYVWIIRYVDGNDMAHTDKGTVVLIR